MQKLIPTNRALCILGAILLGAWAMAIGKYEIANGVVMGLFALIKGAD